MVKSTLYKNFSVIQALLGLLFIALWWGIVLSSPLDQDYTTGELLDHSLTWSETGRLYGSIDHPPYRVLNYPPVFPILVRGLQKVGLPPLSAGRGIALFSFLGAMILSTLWLLKLKCDKKNAAVLVIAFFGSTYPLLHYSVQFHIQWLAVFLSLLGFYLLANSSRRASILGAALVLGLSCWVKQNQVIPALIAAAWLFTYRRKRFYIFFLGLAGIGLLGAAGAHLWFGVEIWRHILTYTVGTYSWGQFTRQLELYFLPISFFAGLGLWLGYREKGRRCDLRWWYFIGGFITLSTALREGAGPQYFLEWSLAAFLWIGPFLNQWVNQSFKNLPYARWVSFLIILQFLGADLNVAWHLNSEGGELKETVKNLNSLCAALPEKEILVPIEEAGLARACGRHSYLHPFIMSNLSRRGLWDEGPFVTQLSQETFPVILLLFDPRIGPEGYERERWTPRMVEAIHDHYQAVSHPGKWWVSRPLGSP